MEPDPHEMTLSGDPERAPSSNPGDYKAGSPGAEQEKEGMRTTPRSPGPKGHAPVGLGTSACDLGSRWFCLYCPQM